VAQNAAADYFVCGLHLRSELLLPELAGAVAATGAAPTVEIRLGSAGAAVADVRHVGPTFQVGANDYLLDVRHVARYRVREGAEIIVEPAASSAERDVRLFLLGIAFGALCHQRGLLPLHASAIPVDGRCIAFAGRSRAGKSTLGAHLAAQGYPILADDLCVLSFAGDEPPLAWPGIPNMKLWRDALAALGRGPDALEAVRTGLEKYYLPLNGQAAGGPMPLARIYGLHEARLPQQEGIERLHGAAAFGEVLDHTYRRHLLAPMGCAGANFAQCAALVKHVPVYSVRRRWGYDCFAEEMAKLERHFLGAG
jgi:hypothetical protein